MASVSKQKIVSKERLNKVFEMFDRDANGYIEAEDLKVMFGNDVSSRRVSMVIAEVDKNQDRRISISEFR